MKIRVLLALLCLPWCLLAQKTELLVPGQNLFVNKINLLQSLAPDLQGEGITISIKEFAFDTNDVDLRGRVIPSPAASNSFTAHANIMASLAGGAGNADLQGRGVAPGCRLVSSSFLGLLPDVDYQTANISVQNHSYGLDIQNYYGSGAVAYDQTTIENPSLLHVFSAGNKGDSAALSGTYGNLPSYANLSGNFKMAKNLLLVGAVDSFQQISPLSSSGPAYDGRTKPDLVAFGYDGSSGAAALVSGAAAVIQQALLESSNEMPGSDLVRAVLINSAEDIGASGPDFETGFGNLNLFKAALLVFNATYQSDALSAGQTRSFPLQIPENIRQCKLTLAWNDPVAPLFAQKALLNDLDVSLVDPAGNEHFPWVLNTFPQLDSLRQSARRGKDTLNNVEQITLDFPSAGLWEIRVKAPTQLIGNQNFALAWSMDTLGHFAWNYPFTNDPCPANTDVILRWETNLPDSTARLEWRAWPSANWRTIDEAVPLQRGWTRWTYPDTFAESQLRMVVNGQAFNSYIFLISKPLRINVGFNCPDSVLLYWNSAHPDAHYWLYGLGATQMERLATVNDTFVVLQKANFPQSHFAVAPLAPWEDALGPRSSAPDISKQGVQCYFYNFLAELNADAEVDLTLQLGTNYAVDKIFFEKKNRGVFEVLSAENADRVLFDAVDPTPHLGANTYRPRILLNNGSSLIGDTVTVYRGGPDGWWIFPNPAPTKGVLNVVSATDGEAYFRLYDVLGKQVLTQKLEDINVQIPLIGLSKGLYFFKIQDGDAYLGEGKVIIE